MPKSQAVADATDLAKCVRLKRTPMKSSAIDDSRIKYLNSKPVRDGAYILYWMQQSQRAEDNHALEYAVELANTRRLPVVVVFCLMVDYPEANGRHFRFMLEGLAETQKGLMKRGIPLVVTNSGAREMDLPLTADAAAVVVDRGYLRHQKAWRDELADKISCRLVQVETDVLVPVEVISPKAEYAARTIRPKIHRHLKDYLKKVPLLSLKTNGSHLKFKSLDISNPDALLKKLKIDDTLPFVSGFFKGGTSVAKKRFNEFVQNRLVHYDKNSNQPQTDDVSHMSPYLHFGQVSPVYLALKIHQTREVPKDAKDAYIEELVVRRELAMNFAQYTPNYGQYDCIPAWARSTLFDHETDQRGYDYSLAILEAADTHDIYWNAAMNEMIYTGFMHNYMRMYWAKKIIEWSALPKQAFETTLYLNNKYFLDGRDPNSYTGVAWCYGVHDRAWKERAIFGKVRYMAASGLERKCDIQSYVAKIDRIIHGHDLDCTSKCEQS